MTSLDGERDRVDRALGELGVGWGTWPGVAATGRLDPRTRLAALVLLLAVPVPSPAHRGAESALWAADEVIDRLRRRRLPWDPSTARLALDVVVRREAFDDRRVAVALSGAGAVVSRGRADARLLGGLQACVAWLDEQSVEQWGVPACRSLARRVLASAAPPQLLDLSLVRDGDHWGTLAREAASRPTPDDVAPLVRRLGELGPGRPSLRWRDGVRRALAPTAARELVRAWLDAAARADVVQPDQSPQGSAARLLAEGNDDLVRAAVLATCLLPQETWVPQVLGALARRGAASSGTTTALALKVASAAVQSLTTRGSPADRAVLEELLVDLSRRDLLRRIGAALQLPGVAAARDDELRRTKAAAVRRTADPAPRRQRAAVDALLHRHVAPELRRLGFTGTGRTWRRAHPDRLDVVALGSTGDQLGLEYGTRFLAAHPPGDTYPVHAAHAHHDLDVRLAEDWEVTGPDLDRCAEHLRTTVAPFLESLGRYEFARAYLEHGAGPPRAAMSLNNPRSPAADGILGLLAVAAGDADDAARLLTRRLAAARAAVDHADASDVATAVAAVAFWREQLQRARLLATDG